MISPDKPSIETIIHILVPDEPYAAIVSLYILLFEF
jgi:hypothetical protein